ncbi:hypothetical protein [Candidatus Enterococcus ikei]|uniref:CMP/dCMP-type deaminase domain-containing protein n=1 Tax=Candidatus Enterococcus ikei TaxID=2815326 RepID=A0ABS3GXQ6_9ENTE|nr:hypothetical protein [Enterococcus sp. DIV0869a]MBO0439610.1 hypothetical protein [Enterococcus sp. DIV0869a]
MYPINFYILKKRLNTEEYKNQYNQDIILQELFYPISLLEFYNNEYNKKIEKEVLSKMEKLDNNHRNLVLFKRFAFEEINSTLEIDDNFKYEYKKMELINKLLEFNKYRQAEIKSRYKTATIYTNEILNELPLEILKELWIQHLVYRLFFAIDSEKYKNVVKLLQIETAIETDRFNQIEKFNSNETLTLIDDIYRDRQSDIQSVMLLKNVSALSLGTFTTAAEKTEFDIPKFIEKIIYDKSNSEYSLKDYNKCFATMLIDKTKRYSISGYFDNDFMKEFEYIMRQYFGGYERIEIEDSTRFYIEGKKYVNHIKFIREEMFLTNFLERDPRGFDRFRRDECFKFCKKNSVITTGKREYKIELTRKKRMFSCCETKLLSFAINQNKPIRLFIRYSPCKICQQFIDNMSLLKISYSSIYLNDLSDTKFNELKDLAEKVDSKGFSSRCNRYKSK